LAVPLQNFARSEVVTSLSLLLAEITTAMFRTAGIAGTPASSPAAVTTATKKIRWQTARLILCSLSSNESKYRLAKYPSQAFLRNMARLVLKRALGVTATHTCTGEQLVLPGAPGYCADRIIGRRTGRAGAPGDFTPRRRPRRSSSPQQAGAVCGFWGSLKPS
jgi:hypothetical protein